MAFDYFYVELRNAKGKRPYFWGQDKATTASVGDSIRVKTKKKDIEQLLQIPGPTYYIMGVHEPSNEYSFDPYIRERH